MSARKRAARRLRGAGRTVGFERTAKVPAVRIRRAAAADAVPLARLRFEFRSTYTTPIETRAAFVRRCARWMRVRLRGRVADERWRCWIAATPDGEIVGHVWLCVIEKVPNPSDEREAHAYITNLYVRPAFRGGVGNRLLAAACEWCQAHAIDAAILWPTPRSRRLYERRGFAVSRRIFEISF